jgi:hypothetical protein
LNQTLFRAYPRSPVHEKKILKIILTLLRRQAPAGTPDIVFITIDKILISKHFSCAALRRRHERESRVRANPPAIASEGSARRGWSKKSVGASL